MRDSSVKAEIRELRPKDLPRVLEIERICFPDPWSVESFRGIISSVAYFSFGYFRRDLWGYLVALRAADELHILNIAVEPSRRREGLGTQLLQYILDKLESRLKVVYLEVRASNAPALAFYQKWGFQSVGVRKSYYRDGEDALVMALNL